MEQTATFFLTIVQDLDLNDPLAAAGYQTEVTAFFKMVRGGQLKHSEHQQLVEAFCKGVDRDGFWPLAQMAVPELRGNQGERLVCSTPERESKLTWLQVFDRPAVRPRTHRRYCG